MLVIVNNAGLEKLISWCNRYKQRKVCKKVIDIELMPIVLHPEIWRDRCVSEDGKKKLIDF